MGVPRGDSPLCLFSYFDGLKGTPPIVTPRPQSDELKCEDRQWIFDTLEPHHWKHGVEGLDILPVELSVIERPYTTTVSFTFVSFIVPRYWVGPVSELFTVDDNDGSDTLIVGS